MYGSDSALLHFFAQASYFSCDFHHGCRLQRLLKSSMVRKWYILLNEFLPCHCHYALTARMAEWYRASASRAVDSDLIPSWVKPTTLKLAFTASLLDAQR